jgi:beta-fructofuranosidase
MRGLAVLRLPDSWLWDVWFAQADGVHHVFFLYASRALRDPDRRHLRAGIGHAVSSDLRSWIRLPDAFVHADAPAFDETATWTGSVVQGPGGRWFLFYTGLSARDDALLQQIAVAVSDDLISWHRYGTDPVVLADPRWYERLGEGGSPWLDERWRDPWVFADPGGDGWHLLITARAAAGPPDDGGVIGHACSADLLHWRVEPPLSRPGSGFGQLEVPQVAVVDGRPVLIFSCLRGQLAAGRLTGPGSESAGESVSNPAGEPTGGIWSVACDAVTGPFDVAAATPLTDDQWYSGRLVADRAGGWMLMAFRNRGRDGDFVGALGDPMPVAWDDGPVKTGGRPRLVVPELGIPVADGAA